MLPSALELCSENAQDSRRRGREGLDLVVIDFFLSGCSGLSFQVCFMVELCVLEDFKEEFWCA